jgi:thioredoxin reductase (NADPH)
LVAVRVANTLRVVQPAAKRVGQCLAFARGRTLAIGAASLCAVSCATFSVGAKTMDVIVIGDGPGGLSAALFLAKGGLDVTVYGQDKTAMHWALLKNYLGLPEIAGSAFQSTAREQVAALGAKLVNARVESIDKSGQGFDVTLESGEKVSARFVILSEGKSPRLADQLGLAHGKDSAGLAVDHNGQSSLAGVYAVGRLVRPERSQAIISAGDGAAAALDILSTVQGKSVQDWDSPPKT